VGDDGDVANVAGHGVQPALVQVIDGELVRKRGTPTPGVLRKVV
jgi:hypothetical protein